jgi:hypothetical protein
MSLEKKREDIFERFIPQYKSLSQAEIEKVWDNASPQIIYELNSELQKLMGRGKDLITCNELGRADRHICEYPDLLSYDLPYWQFQEFCIQSGGIDRAEKREQLIDNMNVPKYIAKAPKEYFSKFQGDWIRLFYNDKLVYGSLYTAENYIFERVDELVELWIEQRYPYKLQMNTYITKGVTPGEFSYEAKFASNNEVNAEKAHESRMMYRKIYWKLLPQLSRELKKQAPATFLVEALDFEGFPHVDFVFRNAKTLSMVRPNTFIEDFELLRQNDTTLEFLANKYAKIATNYLLERGL